MKAARKYDYQKITKEYLDNKPVIKENVYRKRKAIMLENALLVTFALTICLCLSLLLIVPAMKEANLHKYKVNEYTYKVDIQKLKQSISEKKKLLDAKRVMKSIEIEATKYGLVRKRDVVKNTIIAQKYYSLKDAKKSYYSVKYYVSNN